MPNRGPRGRVVLVGDIGGASTLHVGDEAMFAADLALVRRLLPESACVAVSADPEHTAATYGIEAVGREAASTAAGAAELLVVTGGGNLNSTFPDLLAERLGLARATVAGGGAVVLLGQMLGPHLSASGTDQVRELLDLAVFVGARDADSAAIARDLGAGDDRLVEQLDDAWACGADTDPRAAVATAGDPYVAVTMHPDSRIVAPDAIATVASRLAAIAELTGAPLVLLPHCRAPEGVGGTSDEDVSAALAERLASSDVPHMSLPVLEPSVVAAVTRASALVLSSRYHPLVFGISGGVPSLGVWADGYVHSKQRGVLAAAGLDDWLLGLDDALEHGIVDAASELWDRRSEIGGWLATTAPARAARVARRDRALAERLQAVGIDVALPAGEPAVRQPVAEPGPPPAPRARWHRSTEPGPGVTRRFTVVDEVRLVVRPDHLALTARVRSREIDATDVRFRIHDPAMADRIDASATPLLPFSLLLAASSGTDLLIDAPVDTSALDGVEAVTKLYRDWWGFRPPVIDAVGVERDRVPSPGVGLWYSRGVDSTDTLLRSLEGTLVEDGETLAVTHLLGLDWIDPPFRTECAPAIWSDTAAAAHAIGLPLLRVSTNVRDVLDQHAGWKISHGTVFAGLSLLVGPLVGTVLISASAIGDRPRPLGSHPLLDPLFSTMSTRILHVGRQPRSEKIPRIVANDWALAQLKVCWEEDSTRNCGRCAKCLATMTLLEAAGALDRADRFDAPLTAGAVRAVAQGDGPVASGPNTTQDAVAVARTIDAELFAAWREVEERVMAEAPEPLSGA